MNDKIEQLNHEVTKAQSNTKNMYAKLSEREEWLGKQILDWEAQFLSYLKMTGKRLWFLINFHVPLMKDGIKRIIL